MTERRTDQPADGDGQAARRIPVTAAHRLRRRRSGDAGPARYHKPTGIAPRRAGRPEQVVQPAVVAADRIRGLDRRGRRRQGSAGHDRRCSSSSPTTRAPSRRPGTVASGAADLGRRAALLQPVPADLHHPVRAADPQRPSAAVLDPAQHPGQGLVPHPEAGSGRPAVDGEEGLHQPARPGRAAGHPALDRAGPLVAPGREHPVAAQRACSSTCCCSRPGSGGVWCRPAGRCSRTRCRC